LIVTSAGTKSFPGVAVTGTVAASAPLGARATKAAARIAARRPSVAAA
jgi:hypothetical protein